MTGLCGWLGGGSEDQATQIIGDMSACLSRGSHDRHILADMKSDANSQGGMAVAPGGDMSVGDDHVATVYGRVQWRDEVLAAQAGAQGNAEAFVAGYRKYGADVLEKMTGPFSVALILPQKNEALIAIDRMGIQSLCYTVTDKGDFVFSTVTDSLKKHPAVKASIPAQAIYNYLYFFVVPSPSCIYEQFTKLESAQYVHFSGGQVKSGHYWHMPYTQEIQGDKDIWAARLKDELDESFLRTIEGREGADLGCFLSGGLDSSTVTGLMMKHNGGGHSFTIGFDDPKYDESAYARIAAGHFSSTHHEYFVVPDDVPEVSLKIAEIYDEPYGNTSAVPAYYCAKMAREQGITTLLAGDGGDEIFAGNERYAMMKVIERYGLIPKPLRQFFLEPLLSLPGVKQLPVFSKAHSLAKRYATPMPERLYSYSFISEVGLEELFADKHVGDVDAGVPLDMIKATYGRSEDTQMLQKMMHMDMQITLADNDIRKINRMCELAGVEVRYPFLDEGLAEFAASVPSDVLLPGRELRHFFKYTLRDFLPQEVLTKEKHGFGLPFGTWIKKDMRLKEMVCDNLSDFKGRGYLRHEFLDGIIAACQGQDNTGRSGLGWDIAMLNMWLDRHHS